MRDNRLLEMRIFRAVVETGGFTPAGHALGIGQSYASRTVARLEARLGVKLLHRSTRGNRITDEGQQYYAACCKILDSIEAAESQLTEASGQVAGALRISAPIAFGSDQITPILPRFMAANPLVDIHFSMTDRPVSLIDENVDVAVRMGRLRDSSLMARKLCDLRRIVVAAPAYIRARGAPRTPKDLAGHNCLMWTGSQAHLNRWPFVQGGRTVHIPVSGAFHGDNGMALFQLCLAGVGVLRVAEHWALPAIARGDLTPLLGDFQAQDDSAIHAVYLPDRQVLPKLRGFVDFLAESFAVPPWERAAREEHRRET